MTIITKSVQNAMAHCNIDYDDIIDHLLDMTTPIIAAKPATTDTAINAKRERLVALVAGENARYYLGRDLTSKQIHHSRHSPSFFNGTYFEITDRRWTFAFSGRAFDRERTQKFWNGSQP